MRRKKKGLTLVEVIVSLAILSILITPVLSMVLSSVKTSKSGEDKQQALYLAQQYIEEEKSAGSVSVGTSDKPEGDFKVEKSVSALADYAFPDVKSNNGTSVENDNGGSNVSEQNNNEDDPKTFAELAYDCKLIINSNKNSSKLDIVGKASNLPLDKTEENIIEVIGGEDTAGKKDINKITIKYNDVSYQIDKQIEDISDNSTKKGYMLIHFTGDTELTEEDIPKIKIKASNYSNSELAIYFAREVGIKADYSLLNLGGKVKSYSNIFSRPVDDKGKIIQPYTNTSRVYKITIKVWKKDQDKDKDKPIQEITAYKNVAE